MRKRLLFVFMIGAALILAACGSSDNDSSTGTPVPTVTSLPTETPVPTAIPLPMQSTLVLAVVSPGDLAAEGITLQNLGPVIDLTGWQLVDSAGQSFTFPDFRMAQDASVMVFSRAGAMTPRALYWGAESALWSAGSTIVLQDADGQPQAQVTVGE